MSEEKNIGQEERFDERWRRSLDSLKIEPSARVWSRLNRRILWKEIARFHFSNVPGYMWVGITAAIVVTVVGICWLSWDGQPEPGGTTPPLTETVTPAGPESAQQEPVTATPGEEAGTLAAATSGPAAPVTAPVREPVAPKPSPASWRPASALPSAHALQEAGPVPAAAAPSVRIPLTISLLHPYDAASFPAARPFMVSPLKPLSNPKPSFRLPDEPASTKKRTPQFLQAGVSLTPDIVFYKNSDSYFKYDYTLDAGLTYNFGRFYLQTGAGVAWSTDIGNYAVSANVNDSIGYYYQVVSFGENPGNPGHYQFTTQLKTVYDTVQYVYDYSTKNTYTYLQIPLSVGYRAVDRPRWSLGVDAGGFWSCLIATDEPAPEYYLPEGRVTSVENNTPGRVKSSFGLTGSLRFEYRFAKRFSLVLAPTFKYHLNAIDDQEIPGSVQPWSVGLRTGIWYRIDLTK